MAPAMFWSCYSMADIGIHKLIESTQDH